ncbi:MAG: hypothetical protein ACD_48C00127G0003 [uncultured bacterium]|nr:MAG: hypothetical protein ACD_48C00127G0003 [uncultured bacterium]
MPSIFLSFTRSAILITKFALFTWYGSSVMEIADFPCPISSISAFPRMTIFPFPVPYASLISFMS